MQEYNIKITFEWDEGDDAWEGVLYIPNHTRLDMAAEIIKRTHSYLCTEDEEDIYGIQGRSPATLLDYVCEKYGWTWKPFVFDIDLYML